ncbi:hypothetical protein [Nocardia nepalensis]|uniref:hypothetical protein n=1 Tax=Nocardia nepalensis TaxID=3375448 RepID=UPI003B684FF8
MSGPRLPWQVRVDTEGRFLRRVLEVIDAGLVDDTNLDDLHQVRELFNHRLVTLSDASNRAEDGDAVDPVVEVIGAELHRLRRLDAIATVVTRGGFRHDRVWVSAVHRHHTVVHHDTGDPGVLLPLAFIESVQQLP